MYGEHPVELGLDRGDRWLDAVRARRRCTSDCSPTAFRRGATTDSHATTSRMRWRASNARSSRRDRPTTAITSTATTRRSPSRQARGGAVPQPAAVVLHVPRRRALFERDGRRAPARVAVEFHNTGLYNLAGALSYPAANTGLHEVTADPEDIGKFKAPTLRNIAVTAPYMHDGSVAHARRCHRSLRRRRAHHRRWAVSRRWPRQPEQERHRFAASR